LLSPPPEFQDLSHLHTTHFARFLQQDIRREVLAFNITLWVFCDAHPWYSCSFLSTCTTYCALVSYPSPKSKYLTVVTGHECPDDVLFLRHMHVKDVRKLQNPAVKGLEAYLCLFLTLLDNLSRMLIRILILIICLVSIPNLASLEYIRSIP